MNYVTEIINSNMDTLVPSGISTIVGYKSYDMLSNYMLVGEEGIKYYAEAHLSPWNAWIHTAVMPYSMYGMLFWLPALFNLKPLVARKMMWSLYALYGGHYYRVNKMGALLYYAMYYYTVKKATVSYNEIYRNKTKEFIKDKVLANRYCNKVQFYLLRKGLFISFCGLLFQEIFGHWIGGDIASRPEAVLNAIVYAMYFSSGHILGV